MNGSTGEPELSHLDERGAARMVDVSAKEVTRREAEASARVAMKADVIAVLLRGDLPKGDAVAAARLAGIMAAKRTSELIPLCHPLPLEHVAVELGPGGPGELVIRCRVRTTARTGVEMEALTGAAVAALTLYDMAKSADQSITIGPVRLESKSGGRRGTFRRTVDASD